MVIRFSMLIGTGAFFVGTHEAAQKAVVQQLPGREAWNAFMGTLHDILPELASEYYILVGYAPARPGAREGAVETILLRLVLPSDVARGQLAGMLGAIAQKHPTFILFTARHLPWRECNRTVQTCFPPGQTVSEFTFAYTPSFAQFSAADLTRLGIRPPTLDGKSNSKKEEEEKERKDD